MATNTVTTPNRANTPQELAELRLQVVGEICHTVTTAILNARTALASGSDNCDTAWLVLDALDRIGYMAERAGKIANPKAWTAIAGGADGWMLQNVEQSIKRIEAMEAGNV